MARPEKITNELIQAICEDIAQGFSYDQAAQRNSISASTFFRWKLRAEEPNSEQIYRDFANAVSSASRFSEQEALQLIRSTAIINRNWKAAAWFLERRFTEKYGKEYKTNRNNLGSLENSEEKS